MRLKPIVVVSLMLAASAGPALAHPHVWVTMDLDFVFNDDGKITVDELPPMMRHRFQ
mgnify:CR=1 FL=1